MHTDSLELLRVAEGESMTVSAMLNEFERFVDGVMIYE